MKATEAKLLNFLKPPKQFVIPIYQRTYSWTIKQCQQIWDDILRVAQDPARTGHFVGSIVYVERGLHNQTEVPQLLVIDGQQRLTTLTLLLAALRKVLPEAAADIEVPTGAGSDIPTARKISNYYLVNNEEEGNLRPKLLLTQSDRDTLLRIVDGGPSPTDSSRRIAENYKFFEVVIAKATKESIGADVVYRGLTKLLVVDIALDRAHDNPQLIFESLNSTGLALSQADLIRNYILMGLEPDLQRVLYEQYWFPMEQRFSASLDAGLFDRFMRDYLTVKTGQIPNIRDVYEAFKSYAGPSAKQDVRALVADIATGAKYFARMAFADDADPVLARRFSDLNELKVDVAYPLLLELYYDHAQGLLSRNDFARALELIESYVFRRAITGIPTNSLNKTFAEFADHLEKTPGEYLESFVARLSLLESYRRFPTDEEFAQHFITRDVYTLTARRHYLLRKLENHERKEPVAVSQYTIEHILPQNPDLSLEWRTMLGPRWPDIQTKYLHTIGNLTLTGYNSELSDRPFQAKRDMEGGFRDSPLRLNHDLGRLDRWTENEILVSRNRN
jgi:uncharacterized protein with ParB-like and HNH nuclease domain